MTESCPMCKRPFPGGPRRRVCARCRAPIQKHHKWQINEAERMEHRNCNEPESYTVGPAPVRP